MSADERGDGWTLNGPDREGAGGPWPGDEDWDPDAPGLDDEDWGPGGSWRDDPGDAPGVQGLGRGAAAAEAVPEVLEAGFLPRDTFPPGRSALAGPAGGFASGNELDTLGPCVTLAGFADDVSGPGGRCDSASDDELVGVLRAWDRLESWAAGRKLSVIAELIRRRPAPGCQPEGPGGLPAGWGKFCGDELAAATATSGQAADKTLTLAYDLTSRLPGTAAALHEGTITLYKARIIADATHLLTPAEAAAAEALALRGAAGKTPGQLRVAVTRAVTAVNPAAAQARREKAQRDARVELWREDAGTAALCGRDLPPAEALAADQAITGYARDLKAAGLDGTLDQLRARAFLDLALGVCSRPPHPRGGAGESTAGEGGPGESTAGEATGAAPAPPPASPRGST